MQKEILDSVFRAYDIRGKYPKELSPEFYVNLAKAYSTYYKPRRVVVGHDIRKESPELKENLIKGFIQSGVDVTDVGEVATEMIYFATGEYQDLYDGGLIVTASHNPAGWNGCKLVTKYAKPISADSGLPELKDIMIKENYEKVSGKEGTLEGHDIYPAYKKKILSFIKTKKRPDLNVVVDAGNGIGGKIFDYVFGDLGIDVQRMYFVPDGRYPNHTPDPMKEENVAQLKKEVIVNDVEFGIAIDGDADRVFFIDKKGRKPDGAYTGIIFAKFLLSQSDYKEKTIIHDPRNVYPFEKEARKLGARNVQCKAGHSFFKDKMAKEKAIFGAESSSHFYYKDFYNADSGMTTIALMFNMYFDGFEITKSIDEMMEKYPKSGEVNYKVGDAKKIIQKIENSYRQKDAKISKIDGISVEFNDWRFNLRPSNTEPLLRLNVEAVSIEKLVEKFKEVEGMIGFERDNIPSLVELQ